MDKVLVYLHGFNSSPDSHKAQLSRAFLASRPDILLLQPQLAVTPAAALAQLRRLVAPYRDARLGFVGSSLGGFLATVLREEFGGRAVLVNPAVEPANLFEQFLGEYHHPYTGEHYVLDHRHVTELASMQWRALTAPADYWVLLQAGDEVLDYRRALAAYADCHLSVEPRGDHSFLDFSRYLNATVEFLFPVD